MPHIIQNAHIQLVIEKPLEGYVSSRFDWTGKLLRLKYKGKELCSQEFVPESMTPTAGIGFFNEFGMEAPLGYEPARVGDLCHKIGVGQIEKTEEPYDFLEPYPLRPAQFEVEKAAESLLLRAEGLPHNGYGYQLEKEILLLEDGFQIGYQLHNTGEHPIQTEEYTHNFLAFDNQLIGPDYVLKFPFEIKPEGFGENVNPEGLVRMENQEVSFLQAIGQTFFFSLLSGGESVPAEWSLENHKLGLGLSETGSFHTRKVNLWGLGHVISPELFVSLDIPAGTSQSWTRTYRIYEL